MTLPILIWAIPFTPLLAFFLIVLGFCRNRAISHWLALSAAGLSWLGSMVVFWKAIGTPNLYKNPFTSAVQWLPTGNSWFEVGVYVDPLTAVSLFFVAWTIFMIFIYSVGYHNYGQPEGDHDHAGLPPHGATIKDEQGHQQRVLSIEPMYSRFFAFIALFAFGMYLLVVTDNLLILYMGWEIMGLCSYLLIGFWYAKPSARDAAVKAFLTTRIGDVFMLLGIAALYTLTGTLNYQQILNNKAILDNLAVASSPVFGLPWAGLIGLLIFMGTIGKSAQFPLHVWLPDAMEGPTPVSAMIHAATMVSAGVYLALRFFPLISAGWQPGEPFTLTMTVMGGIGAFTALFAASIAMTQNDIKRVLAYSTISQLGYMVAALGVGAFVAAAFHLITHAFFKALLFLGSGSVIHGMEHGVLHTGDEVDAQDMWNMGGLRKKMPLSFWTFLIGGFALSGFPLVTAGFWSKDEIISGAFNSGNMIVFAFLALAALITAFYTMRQITLTFLGKPRSKAAEHASESRLVMTIPLCVLAFFAVTAGWVGVPESFPGVGGLLPEWFQGFLGSMLHYGHSGSEGHSSIPLITSLCVALGGLLLGWLVYRGVKPGEQDPMKRLFGGLFDFIQHKYYIDEIYQRYPIRFAVWIAETFSFRWVDLTIIDGALHAIGNFMLWLGRVLRNVIDIPLINGAGDGLSTGTRRLGVSLRVVQSGKIQQYLLIVLFTVILTGIFLVIYFGTI